MGKNLYDLANTRHLSKLDEYAPDQINAFNEFNDAVFQDGALSVKEKETIAVAVAHETQCPYCIDSHTKNAKKAGASLAELTEAVFVTSALNAGGTVTHSTNVHFAKQARENDDADDVLFRRSNLDKLGELAKKDRDGFKGYQAFNKAATKDGELSNKFKETIAVAIATVTQCPYCIEVHTNNALDAGATDEELGEAIMVASALRAGGPYAHLSNLFETYENA